MASTPALKVVPIRGGSLPFQKQTAEMLRKIKNPTEANLKVATWLLRWVNENFRTSGGATIKRWRPFKHGGRVLPGGKIDRGAKLELDSGKLRASFEPFWSKRDAGVGSDLKYAVYQDQGVPSRGLPPRRLIPETNNKKVEREIIRIYSRFITPRGHPTRMR